MGIIGCDYCGKEFYRKPSHILSAEKHYCSSICQHAGRKKGQIIKCEYCGNKAYKSLKDLNRSKYNKFFCTIVCRNKWYGKESRREKHPNWKGGKFSYKEALRRSDMEQKCFLCRNADPRILAVHHIDQNRKNNDITNLMWLCHNCHFLVHHYSRESNKISKK
ncbi:MAG: hypothetical protein A3H60_01040 [Candidatus Zambryskibacteria bacterium RIFCSPLOWO2_02_FULL_44_12b]|uniref:HNH nuclease domain-containing protein n=1 Tax=Candidatus Zambryskibacteria bacterium RIFCSPLOWO2_02_FULL_44_12b TaxID=1802772 RepID=A0A1G2UML9_9BACT|nr:MAG: hypothetical protein A3H60_01040 [Candidatus Zambryskibacteria bacterium RIFCSPLOWO2_02_FULL_44_12b]